MNGSRVVQPSLRCLRLVHVICLDNKYTDSPLVHVSAEKKNLLKRMAPFCVHVKLGFKFI
jgi:hypothetical protein